MSFGSIFGNLFGSHASTTPNSAVGGGLGGAVAGAVIGSVVPLLFGTGLKGKLVSAGLTAVAGGLLQSHTASQAAQPVTGLFGSILSKLWGR